MIRYVDNISVIIIFILCHVVVKNHVNNVIKLLHVIIMSEIVTFYSRQYNSNFIKYRMSMSLLSCFIIIETKGKFTGQDLI